MGDGFRLLFVTSTVHNGESADIATYDEAVQSIIATNGLVYIRRLQLALSGFSASTADVDARDHTGTTGTGVPIYWLYPSRDADDLAGNGKVADDYADFYDGSWDNIDVLAGTEGHTDRPASRYTEADRGLQKFSSPERSIQHCGLDGQRLGRHQVGRVRARVTRRLSKARQGPGSVHSVKQLTYPAIGVPVGRPTVLTVTANDS